MDNRHPFERTPDPLVLGVEYNEDGTAFTVSTTEGFRVFQSASGKLTYIREFDGSIGFANVLSKSSYVGLIGGGPSPHFPPNKFVLWEDSSSLELFKIEYNNTPIRACLTPSRYAVVFDRGVILYKLERQSIDNTKESRAGLYETCPNPHGLCCLGSSKLAILGRTKGQIQIVDLESRKISILPAHSSAIRALALNKDETIVATASDTGTLIRLWSTAQEARIYEVRRGVDQAMIFSIAFSPSGNYLAVTSDKSTLHIFDLPRQGTAKTSRDNQKTAHAKPTTTTRPVSVPYPRKAGSSATGPANSPTSRMYAVSPSPPAKYRLSTSPTDRTSLTPSDFSTQQQQQTSTHQSPGWNDIARQQPQPSYRRRASSSSMASSPDLITDNDIIGYNPPQKWGNLANLPFAPKLLSDIYSTMSCPFEMGDEAPVVMQSKEKEKAKGKGKAKSTAWNDEFEEALGGEPKSKPSPRPSSKPTSKSASSSSPLHMRQLGIPNTWHGGRPPKGKIAWVSDERLAVVGAGRDARWELFTLGIDQYGKKGVGRLGWKRFMEDEGLD